MFRCLLFQTRTESLCWMHERYVLNDVRERICTVIGFFCRYKPSDEKIKKIFEMKFRMSSRRVYLLGLKFVICLFSSHTHKKARKANICSFWNRMQITSEFLYSFYRIRFFFHLADKICLFFFFWWPLRNDRDSLL